MFCRWSSPVRFTIGYGPSTFPLSHSAIKLSANRVFHKRSKHVDVRYHFCRENINSKLVKVKYISCADMRADLLTQGLCSIKHYKLVKELGLSQVSQASLSGSFQSFLRKSHVMFICLSGSIFFTVVLLLGYLDKWECYKLVTSSNVVKFHYKYITIDR